MGKDLYLGILEHISITALQTSYTLSDPSWPPGSASVNCGPLTVSVSPDNGRILSYTFKLH